VDRAPFWRQVFVCLLLPAIITKINVLFLLSIGTWEGATKLSPQLQQQ